MTTGARTPYGWHKFDVHCECAACARYAPSSPYCKVYSKEHVAFKRESTRQASRALWYAWLGTFAVMLPLTFALSVIAGGWTPFAGALLAAVATGTVLAVMTSYWRWRA